MIIKGSYLKQFFIVVYVLTTITNLAQTPPIIYVAKDGTGDYNCNPSTNITNNQIEINQALDYVTEHPDFTTVYLKGAIPFEIDEPILISSNTILTGDSGTVIKLKDNASWWTQDKPMIAQKNRHVLLGYDGDGMGDNEWNPYGHIDDEIANVEIYGFTIDGGMYQVEPSGNRYNTLLHFTYPHNVKIHDMHFINGQSDAVRISSSSSLPINNCDVYNNDIYDCGHDGISFVGVIGCHAHHNKISRTRTNSGLRASHCDSIYFHNNLVRNSISFPPSGYAGIQIQNTEVEAPCTYAEIYENIIYGKNEGIHLGDETNSGDYPIGTMKGVHIHHNRIYKTNTIDIGGGITLTGGIVVMGFQNTLIEHNVVEGSASDGISFRGNTGGHPGYQTIVRNNILINNIGYGINNETPSNNSFISNNNQMFNNLEGNYNNTSSIDDVYNPPLFGVSHSTLNKWHHIVASYDNATKTMKIYINGMEKAAAFYPELGESLGTNTYNLLLGVIYNGNLWFQGRQDEFALWDRALTSSEINTLYNEVTPITGALSSGLQAYFEMENNWEDSSGNDFNAEDYTAGFTTDAIRGSYAGTFDGIDDGVQYPTNISTSNGLTISVWVYRTSLEQELQTIVNKGRMDDFNHFWLYFRGESVIFEIGDGTIREDLEAYIINPEDIDYHLKSEFGRWTGSEWMIDDESSTCIDSGYNLSDYSKEPEPNGGIVNIGVYGNTFEASKSAISSSVEDAKLNEILIYPNPSKGKFFVLVEYINADYKVLSLNGQVLKKGKIAKTINLSEFTTGVYFFIISNKNKNYFTKIIIE